MTMLANPKENLSYAQKGRAAFVFGRPVCPKCVCELTSSSVSSPTLNERFGLTTRRYFGWCDSCNCGCEVEQYKVGSGRWFRHRWRAYSNHKRPKAGRWRLVKELPVPAVVTGPEYFSHRSHPPIAVEGSLRSQRF